jgi:PKD repeat protein
MKKVNLLLLLTAIAFSAFSQKANTLQKATLIKTATSMVEVPSIASQIADGTFIPAQDINHEVNPKKSSANKAVPGKGLPNGNDPLWEKQAQTNQVKGKELILSFEAASSSTTPTDPTAAVGPNHFVNAWNSSFRIWDKAGNPLTAPAALGTILNGNMGDPIVIYDRYADRFIITEFYSDGFGMAVCQGPDPVNDGWYLYTFNTSSFPDYPKFSVWSDGYYITANKDSGSAGSSEVVFACDRDKMLTGDPSAQMVGFPLTDIVTSGFYSPLSFNANGLTLPPAGDAPIVYMQDDAWSGVSTDHLKIWNINVDWTTPGNSTISSPQIVNTAPFDGLFDGGSFVNLPQPSGPDIDALQATIMFMAQYRRFSGFNSVVFNFVVDLDGNDDYAGIRWYELRQTNDGDPWEIYQEGTYVQPEGHSAFSGNMCMDANGNIALAYTIVSSTQVPSLRYTGRNAGDPLGTMTFEEESIVEGTQSDPATRYGDYSQMTIDPLDDATFWSIGEYFNGGRKNHVGVFQIAPPVLTAEFFADATTACPDQAITFTDASLADPTSWEWSFPGGSPSSYSGETPPAISYSTAGTYDVTLIVGDGTETDTETKTDYITIKDVIADFSGTPTSVVIGNTVTFTDESSCNPTSWSWSFPGGIPDTYDGQTPPEIQYDVEGSYEVTLTVSNAAGTDTKLYEDYITVLPPEFNMTNGTITTCMGNFYDSGGPSGDYSNGEDFTMTFFPSTSGSMIRFNFTEFDVESQSTCNYDKLSIFDGEDATATLIGEYCGTTSPGIITANNGSGALTFTFTSDGSVTKPGWNASISCYTGTEPPEADFSAATTTPVIDTELAFTDLSTNLPTSWSWDITPTSFNYVNGTNENSQNPVVQFTDYGFYTVSLTATNEYGSDTEIKTDYLNVIDCFYCPTSYTNQSDDWISNVTFDEINNSTAAEDGGYGDYTGESTTVGLNSSYDISVDVTVNGGWVQNAWVWIDWNQNCDLTDPGEAYDLGETPGTEGTHTLTNNIVVPSDAVMGLTRMRVAERYSSDPEPCMETTFGEAEDYSVNVVLSTGISQNVETNEMIISYTGNNNFMVSFDTKNTKEPLTISVFDLMGHTIIYNKVEGINGKYEYDFDMSYATPGVYLVRLGNNSFMKSKRIVVK